MNAPSAPICDAATVPEGQIPAKISRHDVCLPIGREVGAYRVEQVIAQNHTYVVYRALHMIEKTQVVLKEYFPAAFATREVDESVRPHESRQTAFEEGLAHLHAVAGLLMLSSHPNRVQVDSVFRSNNTLYLCMPFLQGETLFQRLQSVGTMTQQQLLNLLRPVFDALQAVHAKNCLHRDIKPSNIYLRTNGQPVLLDFGSAVFLDQVSHHTSPCISSGYSPIEQYAFKPKAQGAWTDIYALGASLYRAVMGSTPVDAIERGQCILKELEDPYVPLVQCASDAYSLRFLSAIDHALCFRAEDRPQILEAWSAEFFGNAPVWVGYRNVQKSLMREAAQRFVKLDVDLA